MDPTTSVMQGLGGYSAEFLPKEIRNIISEWTYEGHKYLYDEEPGKMHQLEKKYLNGYSTEVDKIFRRTDYLSVLKAEVGDIISMN